MDAKTLIPLLSAGRIAIGLAHVAAPGPVGRQWIGRAADDPATQVMVRAFGIRDLALGAATLGAMQARGTKGVGFTILVGLGIACDVVDLTATASAKDHVPSKGLPVMAVAGAAAAAGAISLVRR